MTQTKLIFILIAILLLSVAGTTALALHRKQEAEHIYTNFIAQLDDSEQVRMDNTIASTNDLRELTKLKEFFDPAGDSAYSYYLYNEQIKVMENTIEKVEARQQAFCDTYRTQLFDSTDIPDKGYVFLLSKEKQQTLADLKTVLASREERVADCQSLKAASGYARFEIDMLAAYNNYYSYIDSEGYDDEGIKKLEGYSNNGYQVPYREEVAKLYGQEVVDFLEKRSEIFTSIYDAWVAQEAGFYGLAQRKFDKIESIDAELKELKAETEAKMQSVSLELAQKRHEKEKKMFTLIKQLQAKDSTVSEGLWVASLLMTANANFYSASGPDFTSPKAATASELVTLLQDKKFLDNTNFSLDGITYSSTDNGYTITYQRANKTYTYSE